MNDPTFRGSPSGLSNFLLHVNRVSAIPYGVERHWKPIGDDDFAEILRRARLVFAEPATLMVFGESARMWGEYATQLEAQQEERS